MSNLNFRQRQFSRAAITYDQYSEVQIEMAKKLFTEFNVPRGLSVLELGCGTGILFPYLSSTRPSLYVMSDFSLEMLKISSNKPSLIESPRVFPLVLDAHHLLKKQFDLIVSGAMIQWMNPLERHLEEIKNSLKIGGRYLCSGFGPRNLYPLAQVLKKLNFIPPQKVYVDFALLHVLCKSKGLTLKSFSMWEKSIVYQDEFDFLRQLKLIGASGWRDPHFKGREWFKKLGNALRDEMKNVKVSFGDVGKETSKKKNKSKKEIRITWQPWIAEIVNT